MQTQQDAVADQPSGGGLQEIIVTARKREEGVQDTPIAISAFSAAELEERGATDLSKTSQMTPNLVLAKMPSNSGVSNAAIFIRGVGQSDFVPTIDPGVGVYIDGVYLGRSVGAVLDLIDVERVEVLRGPQGTLFGRNTIGGAVSLTTKKPDAEFGGSGVVRAGSDARFNINGTLNVPIGDTLFARFTAASFRQDGFVTNVYNGMKQDLGNDDTVAAKAALRWAPSEALEVDFSADWSRDRENGAPYTLYGLSAFGGGGQSLSEFHNAFISRPGFAGFGDPLACFQPANANDPTCYNGQWLDPDRKTVNSNAPLFSNLDVWGGALTVSWKVGDNLQLKSISAYRHLDGEFGIDPDASPLTIAAAIDYYDQEQFSQELQILGSMMDGRLDWILGLYYFRESGSNPNPITFSQAEILSGGAFTNESSAAFGQATFHATDKLDLTVGGRITRDAKNFTPDSYIVRDTGGDILEAIIGFDPTPWEAGDRIVPFRKVRQTITKFVPMVNLSYRVQDNLLTYATYSEGFKGGGFTQRIFPPQPSVPSFKPEFVKSYEGGVKFDGWNNRFRLNVAGFFTEYTDLQLVVTDPSTIAPFVTNAGDAEIWGVEVETALIPADGWLIQGSFGYLHPKRTSLITGVQGLTLTSRFEMISKYTANMQIQKTLQMGKLGQLTPRVEWAFRSGYGTNANNVPFDGVDPATNFGLPNPALYQGDLHLFNASVRWELEDPAITLTGGVDNITDNKYQIIGTYSVASGYNSQVHDRGRQWYIQVGYKF